MRAVVYTRQSLDRTGTGAAVERQRQDCEKLCADRGWVLSGAFSDNDVSASSTKPRPAYTAMLAAVERGEVEVIIAWHVDRLTRKLTELENLIDLAQRTNVRIATVTGDLDLSTDAGRLVGRILASVARGEVERKGARQRRAQQQSAELGKPPGGRRAFGYTSDGASVVEAEAEHLRAAYGAMLAGGSLRAIATTWNATGVTTTMNNRWSHSTVRRTLLNPRNVARRTYKGDVVGPATWPPVTDPDTFDAVHALLSLPSRRTTPGPARVHLLPGLARCHCGSGVMTGRTQHGVRTYRCRTGGHMSRSAVPVDEFVVAVVLARLSRPDAARLLDNGTGPDLARYREQAQSLRDRLDDLATALADGILPLAAVRRTSEQLRRQVTEAEAKLANLSSGDVLAPLVGAPDIEAVWDRLDLARRRSVIAALMTVTLLAPPRGRQPFDPATVAIKWKGRP